jgi:hypothetical protein
MRRLVLAALALLAIPAYTLGAQAPARAVYPVAEGLDAARSKWARFGDSPAYGRSEALSRLGSQIGKGANGTGMGRARFPLRSVF